MKHIVVDLEMNPIRHNPEARRISKLETIEIGAVMLDDNYREVSSFRTYVKPEYNTGIAPNLPASQTKWWKMHQSSQRLSVCLPCGAFEHQKMSKSMLGAVQTMIRFFGKSS